MAGKTGTTQNNADGWFILMHPNLVAGAWVGFNDNRVTMRSNYWGQGGHNAILLVGDFFKTALDEGKIDKEALFPGGRKPEPVHPRAAPEEEFIDEDELNEGVPADEAVEVQAPVEDEAVEVETVPEEEIPPPPPPPPVSTPVPAPEY